MPQYRDTIDDLIRKFGSSWTYYPYNGADTIVYWETFEPSASASGVYGLFQVWCPEEHRQIKTISGTVDPEQIRVFMVNNQLFNLSPELAQTWRTTQAWSLYRVPNRVTARSFSSALIRLLSPLNFILPPMFHTRVVKNYKLDLDWQIVHAIAFQKRYYTFTDNLLELCKQSGAIALSPDFGVMLSSQQDSLLYIFSRFSIIGTLNMETMTINLYHQPVLQELQDFLTRNNYMIRLVVANA